MRVQILGLADAIARVAGAGDDARAKFSRVIFSNYGGDAPPNPKVKNA
jgi:hypothetical protein